MERSHSPRVAQVVEHDLARFDSDDDPLTRLTPVDSVQSHVGQDLSGHPSVAILAQAAACPVGLCVLCSPC